MVKSQPNVEIFFNPDEEQQPQQNKQQLPVPVPVYCRPLMEKEPGMKVSQSKMVPVSWSLPWHCLTEHCFFS